jgi:hypothetical protein
MDHLVHRVLGLITRWKCPHCQRTFTVYPRFALRHKRYVLSEILDRSRQYVESDPLTYRQAVRDRGRPLFHAQDEAQAITADSSEEQKEQEAVASLAPSTLHRWVTTLGQLRHTMRRAVHLIRQRRPATGLFRALAGCRVAPGKYRSPERRRVLQACARLGRTEREYAQTFGASLFPHLATGCGWT